MSMESVVLVISVEWMDEQKQVYHDVVGHSLADGVLTIDQSTLKNQSGTLDRVLGRAPQKVPSRKTLHLPLANIREIVVEVELRAH